MAARATTVLLAVGAALLAGSGDRPARAAEDWVGKLIARTDDIAGKVSKVRGLRIKRPIDKGVVDDTQLRARIVERMNEDTPKEQRRIEEAAAKRWGLIPWDTDLEALVIDLLTEQIAGFYDPRERKLYIASAQESDDDWADMVMAHEIVHALQDQHFDLEKWMKTVEHDADATAARAAVIEGDGVALMIEYSLAEQGRPAPWGEEAIVRLMMAAMQTSATSTDGGQLLDRAPLALREQMIFPYQAGVGFVAALRKTQPWKKVDEVFTRRPPVSTEQILHPELYLADERPDVIREAAPPASTGLVQLHAATWGESGWGTFLRAHGVAQGTSTTAAAGWGGDRVVLYGRSADVAHPEKTTAVALLTWDSEADALEAWDALGKALEQLVTGAPLAADERELRWLDAHGRITAAEKQGDRIVLVVGAPLLHWRTLVTAALGWKVTAGKRP